MPIYIRGKIWPFCWKIKGDSIWFWREDFYYIWTWATMTSNIQNALLVPEKVLSSIYGHGGHLGHVSWIIWTNFHSLTHKAFTWNLALMGPEASEQKIFWKYKSEWPWTSLSIFPYKSIRKQIWPCCKEGQGQLRIIIWINFAAPPPPPPPRVPDSAYQVSWSSTG